MLVACQQPHGPALNTSNVDVFLPLPGSGAAVAYFRLNNLSDEAISIERISSPQFGKVEMHETTINDGIARMRPVDRLEIAARATTVFEAGGKHVMLTQPKNELVVDATVRLEIHYHYDNESHNNESGLVIIDARMQIRGSH